MTWCQCRLPSYFVYSTRTSPLVTNRNPISSACLLGRGECRTRQRPEAREGSASHSGWGFKRSCRRPLSHLLRVLLGADVSSSGWSHPLVCAGLAAAGGGFHKRYSFELTAFILALHTDGCKQR